MISLVVKRVAREIIEQATGNNPLRFVRLKRLGLEKTGKPLITEELGMDLEKVELEMLGTCKKVTISKDETVVLDGAGDKKAIEERCELLRSTIELSTSEYDQERYKKGWQSFLIGGASEAEVGEKKDRVTDALNATKAAVEDGIVPGGGVALLYASRELDKLQTANFDQKIEVQIIQNALKTPVHTIASNAGVEGAGIVDPLKVIRTALVDAASVSSLMTTTEAVVVELPKEENSSEENSSASAMGGGMGGMGGMDY
ncbi:hypothetical protein IFM89_019927 [Coptis chinensis]|uniref:Uncharacterized protein n=1 Tax=Coptis chinensis TaxID=261450 RepID=A0A835LYV3_9MAGN|nr:hypothetical protein IFM89_019927 [Coptis chinensis]